MKIAPVTEIKAHLSAYLNETKKGPIVVTKNGKPVAVILGVTDEEEIERLVLAYSPKFQAILARGRQQIQKTGGIEHKDFWQEVETKTK
jgi:prevent-host-death family protein